MQLFKGHDPEVVVMTDDGLTKGMDFLLTVFDDGTRTIATRPGRGDTAGAWSRPVQLEVAHR